MDESTSPDSPRLGIIISMFPELHETFILRELVALEQRGIDFEIFSLQFPRDPITLDEAIRLSTERTHYSSLFTVSTIGAFLRTLLTHPVKLCKAVASVVIKGRDRPLDALKNLAVLPVTLHFGETGRRTGITHWHGHWANVPTTACWYLHKIHGSHWSAAIHGEDIFSPNNFLPYKLDSAKFSVVCSNHFCNHLKTELGLEAPEKIHLNYHGLDPRVMQHAPGKSFKVRSADDPVALISIGRLVPTKGHDTVIRACSLLIKKGRKLTLQLIGSGPLQDELVALADQEGISEHVTFSGALAFSEVLESLNNADMFCLAPRMIPGHPPDGIPNVIAEAMALRIPVISTRVSAIPELVSDAKTGRLVTVDDVAGFAEAIDGLARDPAEAERLSQDAALRVAELFNQDKNIEELLALFAQNVPNFDSSPYEKVVMA